MELYTQQTSKLMQEYKTLTEQYILLIQEREDLLYTHREYLESLCLYHLGENVKLKIRFSTDIKKNSLKIKAIQTNMNNKTKVSLEKLYSDLEDDINKCEKEFKIFEKKLEYSKNLLNCEQLAEEEHIEIKQIFKILAKKLSPGMNEGKNKKLWTKTIRAYNLNDLPTLKLLLNIMKTEEERQEEKTEDILIENISILKMEIDKLNLLLEKSKKEFPFNIKDKLNDQLWINKENNRTLDVVKQLSNHKAMQEEQLKYLEIWYTMN
ncbi:hypothetical protein [Terrisporobacter sp.]